MYQVAGISLVLAVFTDSRLDASIASLLCALITGAFAFALTFFTLFHLSLVLSGQTTIEVQAARTHHRLEGSSPSSTSTGEGGGAGGAGWRENWRAVFGDSWRSWLLPIDSRHMSGYEMDFDDDEAVEEVERGLIDPQQSRGSTAEAANAGGDSAAADDEDSGVSASHSRSESSGGAERSVSGTAATMGQVLAALSPLQAHDLVPTADSEGSDSGA